jgi:hypothetical protein
VYMPISIPDEHRRGNFRSGECCVAAGPVLAIPGPSVRAGSTHRGRRGSRDDVLVFLVSLI